MAELPEIIIFSQQMDEELKSKEFEGVEVVQEKILNMDKDKFTDLVPGKKVIKVYNKGKWIILQLSRDYNLLLNLGMGTDLFYRAVGQEWPEEYQVRFCFTDGTGFSCRFWWIGRAELVSNKELLQHKATKDIAPSPLDSEFTLDYFKGIVKGRSQIKNLILNQKRIGGIGNVYIHDILFRAHIHPQKQANKLDTSQIEELYFIMKEKLQDALLKGGLFYEKDFYGKECGFTQDYFLVAYQEGKPCPECATTIEKIKTGSTSSYICPQCQKL